jgi:16S rRNA (guanine527-N7)-methyltransferase
VLNCAAVAALLPSATRVVDVGSGAGLPGLVLAICRPDLSVDLVEPMERRTDFLRAAVQALNLSAQVRVVRGRADESAVLDAVGGAEWVTARAVAPLDRLVRWCVPLLAQGGTLLALKGQRAATELSEHAGAIRRAGGSAARVTTCTVPVLGDLVPVVVVERQLDRKGRS